MSFSWRQRFTGWERSPQLGMTLLAITMLAAAAATYLAGGTQSAFPHLFYVPVLIGSFFFGPLGGVLAGLVAGIICGPVMPLDTALGLAQPASGWVIRLVFFTGVGLCAGTLTRSLHRRIDELHQLNEEVVRAFVRALDAKDHYTSRHSEKVAEYAAGIACQMNLPPETRERVRWAALLHDVGKLAVPSQILNKPGKLDPSEWELIQRHPVESCRIFEGVAHFRPLLPAIRHHHERVDGRGYPDGLTAKDLPLEARIIAVADAFDAMTSQRAYRDPMSEEDAIRELEQGAGSQFDPQVVAAFVAWRRSLAAAQGQPVPRVAS